MKALVILTEIDVQATLKKKLNIDFRKYKIPGACNPAFAYDALKLEAKTGTPLYNNQNSSQKTAANCGYERAP